MKNHTINLGKDLSSKKDDDSLGLFIRRANYNPNIKHTGFVFLDNENSKPIRAHLTSRYEFDRKKFKGYGVLWLDFVSERNAAIITAELRTLALKESDMLYGITNYGGTTFQNGVTIPNPDVRGDSLTCATFVLCMLEQFGFNIVDRDSWIISAEDTQWQKGMVEILKEHLQPDFYEIQKENIGKVVRIRPEQIVGACGIFNYSPVKYDEACEAGTIVLDQLDKLA